MTDVRFYHMTRKRLEQALPEIAAKALDRQYRIVVKAGSRERLEVLDAALWTYDPASFLPHGLARDGFEADQPIWLTTGDDNPNGARMIILADGATCPDVGAYDLCCEFFDGQDDEAVASARTRWKDYKESGHTVSYYQQDDQGKWLQKA